MITKDLSVDLTQSNSCTLSNTCGRNLHLSIADRRGGYAGGVDGPWDRIPKDSNVGRWLYVSMAARHVIELREALEAPA